MRMRATAYASTSTLESLFEVTERQWDAATVPNDELLAPAGRVMEMLSEHQCEGWLEGSASNETYMDTSP